MTAIASTISFFAKFRIFRSVQPAIRSFGILLLVIGSMVSGAASASYSQRINMGYQAFYTFMAPFRASSPMAVCTHHFGSNVELIPQTSSGPYSFWCYSPVTTQGFHISAVFECPPGFVNGPAYGWAGDPQECQSGNDPVPELNPCPGTCPVGNPIYPGTGSKLQVETDFAYGALQFARHYNWSGIPMRWYPRRLKSDGVTPTTYPDHWRHNYSTQLTKADVLGGGYWVVIQLPSGAFEFYQASGNAWVGSPSSKVRLERIVDAATNVEYWERTDENRIVERFDSSGKLILRTEPGGYQQVLAYNASEQLLTVTDSFGKAISFAYDAYGRLSDVTDPAGNIYHYEWSARGQLVGVTYPDATSRQYYYEDPTFLDALTGITDEKSVRFATWAYGTDGRAITSEHAGGVERITVSYDVPNNRATVIHANNATQSLQYSTQWGLNRDGSVQQPGGAATRNYGYDSNGNRSSVTDYNGVTTIYVFDPARNLETSRTEAAGTAQARTITTTWHPTYRLPLTVSEPGRTTTYTYDAGGNRLSKTVTDTAANKSQAWTWTYNAFGQVLSEDGPRTDISDVTTYTYYGSNSPYFGKLQFVTNPAGQVTQFTAYNGNGQVLTQMDANGVSTAFTYDSRGRMTSVARNGKTTTYEYDAVGQMTKVTTPDGNWVSYTYDDAHRLTAIQDKAGNRIVYTLDAMSRRVKEEIRDTQGALAKLLKWVDTALASAAPLTPPAAY